MSELKKEKKSRKCRAGKGKELAVPEVLLTGLAGKRVLKA